MQGYGESSYGDGFADVYDDWYHDVSDVDSTVALLTSLVAPDQLRDGRYLELGIGTGRIALPLAETGARVTGIDASRAMIERLRAKDPSGKVSVIVGDMLRGLPDASFDVVFVAYNTLFALRSYERQHELFAEVSKRLVPGGSFVVEAFVPDVGRPAGGNVGVRTMAADRVVLMADVHDPESQTVDGQFIEFTDGAAVRLRPFSIRYSTTTELDRMATDAGLSLAERWEDTRRTPFRHDSVTHVSVYRQASVSRAT